MRVAASTVESATRLAARKEEVGPIAGVEHDQNDAELGPSMRERKGVTS